MDPKFYFWLKKVNLIFDQKNKINDIRFWSNKLEQIGNFNYIAIRWNFWSKKRFDMVLFQEAS